MKLIAVIPFTILLFSAALLISMIFLPYRVYRFFRKEQR